MACDRWQVAVPKARRLTLDRVGGLEQFYEQIEAAGATPTLGLDHRIKLHRAHTTHAHAW